MMEAVETVDNRPVLAVNTHPVLEGEWVAQTVAAQAYLILSEQHQQLEKYQPKILKDPSPEPLHHFRVALRRLATAEQIFTGSLKLPSVLSQRKVKRLRIQLGKQRDLDVLLTLLQEHYYPKLPATEQVWLDQALTRLHQKRQKTHRKVHRILSGKSFTTLKSTYTKWLKHPHYTYRAELPLATYLPSLLLPILSEFLLHPAWLMAFDDLRAPLSQKQAHHLHDLRKICKKVRYQTEFFAEWYDESFHAWLEEIKTLQECLGFLQDREVLRQCLTGILPKEADLTQFWDLLAQEQAEQMVLWLGAQQKYQDLRFHQDLYGLILHPIQLEEVESRL